MLTIHTQNRKINNHLTANAKRQQNDSPFTERKSGAWNKKQDHYVRRPTTRKLRRLPNNYNNNIQASTDKLQHNNNNKHNARKTRRCQSYIMSNISKKDWISENWSSRRHDKDSAHHTKRTMTQRNEAYIDRYTYIYIHQSLHTQSPQPFIYPIQRHSRIVRATNVPRHSPCWWMCSVVCCVYRARWFPSVHPSHNYRMVWLACVLCESVQSFTSFSMITTTTSASQ